MPPIQVHAFQFTLPRSAHSIHSTHSTRSVRSPPLTPPPPPPLRLSTRFAARSASNAPCTLRHLDFANNNAVGPYPYDDFSGLDALSEALLNNQHLITLNLAFNHISRGGVDDAAVRLIEALRVVVPTKVAFDGSTVDMPPSESALQNLDLSDNRLGAEFGFKVAAVLLENRTLHKLCLTDNRMGLDAGAAIGKTLAQNMTLHTLDLRLNWGHDDGRETVTIGNALEENALTGAHASRFHSTTHAQEEAAHAVKAAPRGLVELNGIRIDPMSTGHARFAYPGRAGGLRLYELRFISEKIKAESSVYGGLIVVDLSDSGITAIGMEHLCDALVKCSALRRLNLSNNRICHVPVRLGDRGGGSGSVGGGSSGGSDRGSYLQSDPLLDPLMEALSVEGGGDGARAARRPRPGGNSRSGGGGGIGGGGHSSSSSSANASSITGALGDGNWDEWEPSDVGIVALQKVLLSTLIHTLEYLGLCNNGIGESHVFLITQTVHPSTCLAHLDMSRNEAGVRGMTALSKLVKRQKGPLEIMNLAWQTGLGGRAATGRFEAGDATPSLDRREREEEDEEVNAGGRGGGGGGGVQLQGCRC